MKIINNEEELSLTQKLKLIFNSKSELSTKKEKIDMNAYNNVRDIEPFVPTEKDMQFINAIEKKEEDFEDTLYTGIKHPTEEQFLQVVLNQAGK